MSEIDDVRAFHEKMGIPVYDQPVHLTRKILAERANFMLEELREFADAAGLFFNDAEFEPASPLSTDQDLALQADALVDLVYVALGTVVQLGLPWTKLWDDVHRANMAKERGPTCDHHVGVVKPKGWVPPRTERILFDAAYHRPMWTDDDDKVQDEWCRGDE